MDSTDYLPFTFYKFNGDDSITKETKQFLSYFTQPTVTMPTSNISWNTKDLTTGNPTNTSKGYVIGAALINNNPSVAANNTKMAVEEQITDSAANSDIGKYMKGASSSRVEKIEDETNQLVNYQNWISSKLGNDSTNFFKKKTGDYYYQKDASGNTLMDGSGNPVPKIDVYAKYGGTTNEISEIDQPDALIAKGQDVTIKDSGVYVGGTKKNFSHSGIIITDKNVIIEGGEMKGLIAAGGNVIFKGGSSTAATVAYDESTVSDTIKKYTEVALALGAQVKITKTRSTVSTPPAGGGAGATDTLDVTSGYHVDSMSRFTRTEWTEND